MAVPVSNKVLTFVVVAAGTLIATGAPHRANAPERGLVSACVQERTSEGAAQEMDALDAAQQALVDHLSRRFYIAKAATERMVGAAYRAAHDVGLDPLLVLAVIAIESRFNPIAESVMGAKGLMQIIPKYHQDKLRAAGGEDAVLDPEANIAVGARILQEYVYRTGTLEAGLQVYNGALRDNSAQYAQRVFAERFRLEQVLRERSVFVAARS
jgi:soluble lytic murein transglycosylase-like protein